MTSDEGGGCLSVASAGQQYQDLLNGGVFCCVKVLLGFAMLWWQASGEMWNVQMVEVMQVEHREQSEQTVLCAHPLPCFFI